jgi:hypothetical protein
MPRKTDPTIEVRMVKLEILTCRAHGFFAVTIDNSRVTPDKCCGSWNVVRSWNVPAEDVAKRT